MNLLETVLGKNSSQSHYSLSPGLREAMFPDQASPGSCRPFSDDFTFLDQQEGCQRPDTLPEILLTSGFYLCFKVQHPRDCFLFASLLEWVKPLTSCHGEKMLIDTWAEREFRAGAQALRPEGLLVSEALPGTPGLSVPSSEEASN